MVDQIFDWRAFNKMFLDDAIEIRLRGVVVPDAIGLHAHNGARFAGSKTVAAGPFDTQRTAVDACGFELLT